MYNNRNNSYYTKNTTTPTAGGTQNTLTFTQLPHSCHRTAGGTYSWSGPEQQLQPTSSTPL